MESAPRGSTGWSIVRLLVAALIVAAVIAQLARSVGNAVDGHHDVATVVANFLSFFTIDSNLISMVVLVIVQALRGHHHAITASFPLNLVRACAATYMIITGIVYNTLLRGIELPQGVTVPWSNEVLHVVAPLFMLVELLFGTTPPRLEWRAVWAILVFPLVWVVYTMVRGPLVTNPTTGAAWWYPYPFMDPHAVGGYLGVVPYVIGIAVGLLAFGAGVVWVGRRRTPGSASQPVEVSPADPVR
jgi:hypothetical protein